MSWFFIALAAPFLWSFVNIFDQYLVSKFSTGEKSSGGLILFTSLIGIVVAIIVGINKSGIFQIPVTNMLLLILTGVITISWFILYLFALEIEDVSAVVPWFLTVPIFGFGLGYLFLGEMLTQHQLIGSVIVLIGLVLTFIDFTGQKKKFKWKSAIYMLFSCFLIAICGVIFKYVTIENNFWVSSFWEYVGLGLCGIIIFIFVPKFRREFIVMNKKGGVKIFSLNILIEVFTIGGNLLTNFAILLAPVTMVYLVGSFQPAIVLFLTLIATKFFPGIAKENLSRNVLLPKIIAIAIMIIGSIFLFQ